MMVVQVLNKPRVLVDYHEVELLRGDHSPACQIYLQSLEILIQCPPFEIISAIKSVKIVITENLRSLFSRFGKNCVRVCILDARLPRYLAWLVILYRLVVLLVNVEEDYCWLRWHKILDWTHMMILLSH